MDSGSATGHRVGWLAVGLLAVSGIGRPSRAIPPPARYVFTTSVKGNANLSSWPEAGGATGLAAGDAICEALATSAGLSNPTGFVAWLSDSTSDAYCRIHGLTGTKAANCGQATLPIAAGPWVRTDGLPFSEAVTSGGFFRVYAPPSLDESGAPIPTASPYVFTATGGSGAGAPPGCANFTSASSMQTVAVGTAYGTTGTWTSAGVAQCNSLNRLLCVEVGLGAALPPVSEPGLPVFVTSTAGTADLSSWPDAGGATGLAAGDAICRVRAAAAGLPHADWFGAWLSDGTTSASARLVSDGPWVRLDGYPIAASKDDLVDGKVGTSIDLDENGTFRGTRAWTATNAFGGANAGLDCSGWLSTAAGSGGIGNTTWASGAWTDFGLDSCAGNNALYCFLDDGIFAGDFDDGTLDRWSSHAP